MTEKEKIAVAGFNAFLGLMKRNLRTNKNEQDFQDLANLSYIQFRQQTMFKSAIDWIEFNFTDFSLDENGVQLK
jgi:hypothetical protein